MNGTTSIAAESESGRCVLVTGAGGSAASNIIDALKLGSTVGRIVGADMDPARLHLSAADSNNLLPDANSEDWIHCINWIAERHAVSVVMCQPDAEVMALGRSRQLLEAKIFLPSQTALETARDKVRFSEAMERASVAVPESTGFSSFRHLAAAVGELLNRHPDVWIRARIGAGSRGSLPISTVDQAVAWVSWWVQEKGLAVTDFMAAERLPGREFAFQSVWQDGELIVGQARERLEYLYGHLTPHGQSSTPAVARTVREPVVDDLACDAIRAMDPSPHGIYCVDIKEDRFGVAKVTEVNAGRFFTTSNFFAHAGLNMPDFALRAALGERLPRLGMSPLEPDLFWIRMVDMGYRLVDGTDLDVWPRAHL